jgi:hypothetical protein
MTTSSPSAVRRRVTAQRQVLDRARRPVDHRRGGDVHEVAEAVLTLGDDEDAADQVLRQP